jgi:hypothetical protein
MSSATLALSPVRPRARSASRPTKRPAYTGPDSFARFLERILKYPDTANITVRELLGGLESRAFGIPLAALSAGELVPVPIPGFSLVISLPMAAIGAQMMADRERLYLPGSLLNRRVPGRVVKRIVRAMLPTVRRIDRYTQRRASIMTGSGGRRLAGLAVFLLGLLIALPIPGTNAPLALTVLVIGLGLIRGDGLLIAAGIIMTVIATALMGTAALALTSLVFGG